MNQEMSDDASGGVDTSFLRYAWQPGNLDAVILQRVLKVTPLGGIAENHNLSYVRRSFVPPRANASGCDLHTPIAGVLCPQ